jgi:hypothetical protein
VSFPCGIDDFWTAVVTLDRDGDGGSGDDENDKTVKMAEMVREAADDGNGR